MHWIYLIHEFHNLSWITEINELFHDILIYWDAPVYYKWNIMLIGIVTKWELLKNIIVFQAQASILYIKHLFGSEWKRAKCIHVKVIKALAKVSDHCTVEKCKNIGNSTPALSPIAGVQCLRQVSNLSHTFITLHCSIIHRPHGWQ